MQARTQLGFATDEPSVFSPIAKGLLSTLWREGIGVRLVGIAISGFDGDAQPVQTSLFDDPRNIAADNADEERRRRLSKATDELRARFGNDALSYGRDLRFKQDGS